MPAYMFLVFNQNNVLKFIYPDKIKIVSGKHIDDKLISLILDKVQTNINIGLADINKINAITDFGTLIYTYSKDKFKNLYLLLSTDDITIDMSKNMHIEMKLLYINTLMKYKIDLLTNENLDKNTLDEIFDPIYRKFIKLADKH